MSDLAQDYIIEVDYEDFSPETDLSVLAGELLRGMYPPTEAQLVVIYGKLGKGKSSLAIKTAVRLLHYWFKWPLTKCWEKVKELIFFHPTQFFDKIHAIRKTGIRTPCLIWDDAGLWLSAMKWNDPFIKAVGDYTNVMRSSLSGLILTTPDDDMIYKKIRNFPDSMKVQVDYAPSGNRWGIWGRVAKMYVHKKHVIYGHRIRLLKKWIPELGTKKAIKEVYNIKLPEPFYDWYKPLRDAYEQMALAKMEEIWDRLQDDSRAAILSDYPGLNIPSYAMGRPGDFEAAHKPLGKLTVREEKGLKKYDEKLYHDYKKDH